MAATRYQPPAVQYPVSPPVALWCMGWLVWLGAGGLLLAWLLGSGPQPAGITAMGWLLWSSGALVWWRWMQAVPHGCLRWDGGAWWWLPLAVSAEEQPLVRVQVRWDGQTAMWVAWQSADGRWRQGWLRQCSEPVRWGDWRRAVYSAATDSRVAGDRL